MKLEAKSSHIIKQCPYLTFRNNQFIITDLSHFTDEELFLGYKEFKNNDHNIKIDIHIDDLDIALTYSYKYLYDILLENTILLSNDILNDIFHYELLVRDLFTDKIKMKLENYRINKDDFIKYLKLLGLDDVPLRLQLLDLIDALSKNDRISDFKDYNDICSFLQNACDLEQISSISLVMGYPFAKNRGNKILDFVKVLLRETHSEITIYRKGSAKCQREDYTLIDDLKTLGVDLKTFDHLKLFHDRYIIIKTKTRDFYFLCTCEIGNFFHPDLHEPCGSILQITKQDLIRDDIDLLDLLNNAKRL